MGTGTNSEPSQEKNGPPVNEPVLNTAALQQQQTTPNFPTPSYQQQPQYQAPMVNSRVVYTQPNNVERMLGYCGPVPVSKKSLVEAYLLCLIFGLIGAHHFYLRRPGFGCLYLFTFGLLGCGYVFDLFRLPCLVRNANKRLKDPSLENVKRLDDAYGLWFPFGLVGLHHFYLRQPAQGVFYMCTFGLLGIGWIVDAFRMPSMVEEYNRKSQEERDKKSVCTAYAFGLSPFGILGIHHFYLDRMYFGLLYMFTFGFLGVGWIVDWFRIFILTKRANENRKGINLNRKYLDDAYVLAFPLGFTGLHHFYLGRHGWGLLYFFTFGILGVGWLVDLIRLPCLVAEYNKAHAGDGTVPFARPAIAPRNTVPAGSAVIITSSGVNNPSYSQPGLNPPPYYPPQYGTNYPVQYPQAFPGVHVVASHPGVPIQPPAYTENRPDQANPLPSKQ